MKSEFARKKKTMSSPLLQKMTVSTVAHVSNGQIMRLIAIKRHWTMSQCPQVCRTLGVSPAELPEWTAISKFDGTSCLKLETALGGSGFP